MKAADLMSTHVVAVPPDMPVAAVAEILAARGISAVPVIDQESRPVGIVTEGDLIRRLADQPRGPFGWFLDIFRDKTPMAARFAKAHGKTARDVMTTALVSVGVDASAEQVARLMEQHQVRRVLVLRDGRLVGLVSRADLLRAILRPAAPAEALTDDRDILQAAIIALREQPWTDMMWIFPAVEGGVVSLHGFARSDATRQGLRVLMEEIPGVKGVKDEMQAMPLIVRAMR
jgi:CBS domain-containing protein